VKTDYNKAGPVGYARSGNGLRHSLNQTHPWPEPGSLPRIPPEKLRPLSTEAPPLVRWGVEKKACGYEFHAIVVPLPIRYHVLDGVPEGQVEDPVGLLALEVSRLQALLKRAEKERDKAFQQRDAANQMARRHALS
jgi:hypothetical protein